MISGQLIPALVAMGGLATAGSAAAGGFWRGSTAVWRWWHTAAVAAGLANVCFLAWQASVDGPGLWLRRSLDVTVLLATLVLTVGLACVARPRLRGLDAFLIPLAAVLQAAALLSLIHPETSVAQQAPPWFVLHMLTLVAGTTCFLSAGTAGLVYLVTNRVVRQSKRRSLLMGQVPALESLERFSRWMLTAGLPFFTFGILTGVCQVAQSDRPSVWLREPVVLLSCGLWVAYAVTLVSIWLRPQNRGRRAAGLAASGVAVLLIVFLVMGLFATHQ